MNLIGVNSHKIEKLVDLNKLLTKSTDINFILRTLVKSAQELIGKSDAVIISLYNERKGVLQIVEGVGVDMKYMKHLKMKPGESLTGKTFTTRRIMAFSREEDIESLINTMSPENYRYYIKGVKGKKLKRSFCVPLIYQNDCLGVLIVNNYETNESFTDEEIMIIKAIANQSAVAITNAKYVEHLREKNSMLLLYKDIHKKFTKLVLEGGDKESILLMLGRYLKCKIECKDTSQPEEGYSTFPIIGDNEILSYIHYQKKESSLTVLEEVALEHAATALALNFLKENYLYEKELQLRELYFKEITEGISKIQIERMLSRLDWDVDWLYNCIVISGDSEPLWDLKKIRDKRKLVESLEEACNAVESQGYVFIKGLYLVLILPNRALKKINLIAHMFNQSLLNKNIFYIGVGTETKIHNIGESFHEAKEAVQYAISSDSKIMYFSDLGVERFWRSIDDKALQKFVKDHLGSLLKMDDEYKETLFTYIRFNKSRQKTAEALHIHSNTLYHRIKKIETILGTSFDNLDDWINICLAYQIYCTQLPENSKIYVEQDIEQVQSNV